MPLCSPFTAEFLCRSAGISDVLFLTLTLSSLRASLVRNLCTPDPDLAQLLAPLPSLSIKFAFAKFEHSQPE
jgi:hypothetical protein